MHVSIDHTSTAKELKMEDEQDLKTPASKPLVAKRTARMLHEGSFATSAFTSTRSQSRAPGFVPSSLDYKSSDKDATMPPAVTTKPGNKKNSSKQQQEQLERERQQQQRQHRSGHPTRAQGNYGPPPHSIKSLEDLENMTEEQIYKLFMDDPELHEAFLKATEKEQKAKNVPNSAPVGAQNARSSSRRKTSSSENSKRRSTSSKELNKKSAEREFPYFQWAFLLLLILAALYKIKKSYSISTQTKEMAHTMRNRTGRKQKKKHGGAGNKSSTKKKSVEEKSKPDLQRDVTKSSEKKSPPGRRKKKKPLKNRSTADFNSVDSTDEKAIISEQKENRQNEPDLESTDASSGNNEPEVPQVDLVIASDSDLHAPLTTNDNDEEWQTVTKTSKGAKKIGLNTTVVVEKNASEQVVLDHLQEEDATVEPPKETNKQAAEEICVANDQNEAPAVVQPTEPEKNKEAEVKNNSNSIVNGKEESEITTENDAALALKLHEEELNMTNNFNVNPQEELWEEVIVKKKKGNRA